MTSYGYDARGNRTSVTPPLPALERRRAREASFDREAELRRFGVLLLTVGLAGVGLLGFFRFALG